MTAGKLGAFIIYPRITFHQQPLKHGLLGERKTVFQLNNILYTTRKDLYTHR